MKTCLSDF